MDLVALELFFVGLLALASLAIAFVSGVVSEEPVPRPALTGRAVFDLPTDLPADLAPLSWLIGVWEGTGVIDYAADDHALRRRVRSTA